jgi:hypothetical protein
MGARNIMNRLFGAAEEINGAHRCATYLYRWTVAKVGDYKVYLHQFVGDDWSMDLHDHPKRFVSIGLWGRYLEETPDDQTWWVAPWIRSFDAIHQHRITTPRGHCWTLVIVGRPEREWGFWHDGSFIPWRRYVAPGSVIADQMKACADD